MNLFVITVRETTQHLIAGLVKTETCCESTSMIIFSTVGGVREFANQVARVCFQRPGEAFQPLSIGSQRFSRNNLAVFHQVRVRGLIKPTFGWVLLFDPFKPQLDRHLLPSLREQFEAWKPVPAEAPESPDAQKTLKKRRFHEDFAA